MLQNRSREAGIAGGLQGRRELQVLQRRRLRLVLRAIQCCSVTVALVVLMLALVFLSTQARLDLVRLVVPPFVAAMLFLVAAVLLFLLEMPLAAQQLERRF